MALYILKNRTNSPQTVAKVRIGARATTEPMDLDDATFAAVDRSGLFDVTSADTPADAFDAMSDDELRELYEVVTGKKPRHKMGRAKLLETVRADGV